MTNAPEPRILHVAPAYFPAIVYGGPTFSTMALCDGLAASGAVKVSVLTTDSNGPKVSDCVKIDSNPMRFAAGYDVHYCRRIALGSFSVEFLRRLPGQMRRSDLVHLTSTQNFTTIPTLLLARMLDELIGWSPHGKLQADVTRVFSRFAFAPDDLSTPLVNKSMHSHPADDGIRMLRWITWWKLARAYEIFDAMLRPEPGTAQSLVSGRAAP